MKAVKMKKCFLKSQGSIIISWFIMHFIAVAQPGEAWQVVLMDTISVQDKSVIFDKPTIAATFYSSNEYIELKASKYDRVLFLIEGEAIVKVHSESLRANAEDVLFVKANDLVRISGKSKFLVWASKSPKTSHDQETMKFAKEEIVAQRDSSMNVWHTFIECATMITGLYMLPKAKNGDGTLVHEMDEINYVTSGTAKFKMDDTIIEVQPGSVMWVKRGIGHHFYDLSDDFDVYILFETINMSHEH